MHQDMKFLADNQAKNKKCYNCSWSVQTVAMVTLHLPSYTASHVNASTVLYSSCHHGDLSKPVAIHPPNCKIYYYLHIMHTNNSICPQSQCNSTWQ